MVWMLGQFDNENGQLMCLGFFVIILMAYVLFTMKKAHYYYRNNVIICEDDNLNQIYYTYLVLTQYDTHRTIPSIDVYHLLLYQHFIVSHYYLQNMHIVLGNAL